MREFQRAPARSEDRVVVGAQEPPRPEALNHAEDQARIATVVRMRMSRNRLADHARFAYAPAK